MSLKNELYAKYMQDANKYAKGFGLDPESSTDGEWDAYRHAYASAAMTQDYGENLANLAGWLNEVNADLFSDYQNPKSRNMDLWNNAKGREIGLEGGSLDDLADKALEALLDGDLIVDPDNDDREYDDADHGIGDDNHTTKPSDPHQTPYDPTTPGMSDPLVIDSDKDGYISTISLEDSSAYFDITGDGVKEKVGWIAPNDGILAYDKNNNGKIDGIDEVFGSDRVSGFTELRQIADSNHDGIIDRKDELYSRLKVWHDKNGDGISQTNELINLKDEGIKSINLNAVSTNIEVNGNIITEASKYTDSNGNLELAADVELQYLEKVESNPTATNEFEMDPTTLDLANLRGYGYVENAFNVYNKDENFKTLAKEYANDITKVATNFEEFIAEWSGFYKMAESKGVSKEDFSENVLGVPSIKVWVLERFAGAIVDKWRTEAHIRENTGGGYHTTSYQNEQYIHDSFNKLVEQYESKFAIETFYAEVFSDTYYNIGFDEFVIDNSEAFYSKVTDYLNNSEIDIKNRLYLAQVMNMQEGVFLHFDAETIVDAIQDTELQTTISDIYKDKVHFEYIREDGHYRYENSLIYADDTDEFITLETKQTTTIIAQKGDDKIIDNAGGDTTYIFSKGDGSDIIYDSNGNDTLKFKDITLSEVDIQADGSDLIITRKEDSTDKIIIKDWMKLDNRIENITFAGENQVDLRELLFPVNDEDNYMELTNYDDLIDALDGDDEVKAFNGNDSITGGKGNDILYGGTGNDTYYFNRGDGSDIIIDTSGNDKLQFGEGITKEDIAVKLLGNDLVVALKEDGKTYEELSDKIVLQNWLDSSKRVENILLNDGTIIKADALQGITGGDDTLVYGDSFIVLNALDGDDNITTGSGDDTITGGSGNDTINAGSGNNTISGGIGDDTLNSGNGADTLIGGAGNDTLNAGSGDDTLTGGTGVDTLRGGLGNDKYIFNLGDGHDTIIDAYTYGYGGSSSKDAGNDTIVLGEGISQDDISVTIVGADIVVQINDDDSLTIKNATSANFAVENIELEDGTLLKVQDLQSATEGNDTLAFGNSNVVLDALSGDDSVTTGSGNDSITGGSGNDIIHTNDGADSLLGGEGADTLVAGRGNDTLTGG